MIRTYQDYRSYLKKDMERNNIRFPFLQRITFSENWHLYLYIKVLRKYEYYYNNRNNFNFVFYIYYWLKYRHLSQKTNICIFPNTIGSGLQIMHPGFRRVDTMVSIGEHCTLLPMVLFGKKRPGEEGIITVGDNCYISTGVTILGPVSIGNNVTIAAGAVVINDIPDDCVVGGVPAKVLKSK